MGELRRAVLHLSNTAFPPTKNDRQLQPRLRSLRSAAHSSRQTTAMYYLDIVQHVRAVAKFSMKAGAIMTYATKNETCSVASDAGPVCVHTSKAS